MMQNIACAVNFVLDIFRKIFLLILFGVFLIVAPCILQSTQFTHQQMHYLLTLTWLKVLILH